MVTQTARCKNAVELANPVQVRTEAGEIREYTHTCRQTHMPDHEVFNLTPEGLCPFEDGCAHFESGEA